MEKNTRITGVRNSKNVRARRPKLTGKEPDGEPATGKHTTTATSGSPLESLDAITIL